MKDPLWLSTLKSSSEAYDSYLAYLDSLDQEIAREALQKISLDDMVNQIIVLKGKKIILDKLRHFSTISANEDKQRKGYEQRIK